MKKKGIYYLISFLLIFVLIGVGIGIAYKLTNGFQNITSFVIVNSNGQLVINGSNEYLEFKELNKFTIKGLTNKPFDCNIYGNSNYKYLVNGMQQNFSAVKQSLNSYFNIEVNNNEFTITPNYLAEDIVKSLYKETDVVIDETLKQNGNYFTIKVTTENEIYSFNIIYKLVTNINFDSTGVVF